MEPLKIDQIDKDSTDPSVSTYYGPNGRFR